MSRRILVPLVLGATVLGACGSTPADDASIDEQLPSVAALGAALTQASETQSFESSMSMGLSLDMGALGQTMAFEADLATPMMTMQSDADGDKHIIMDLSPMMSGMLGEAGGADVLGGDLSMETWQSGTTMIVDLGGFAPILEQSSVGGTAGAAGLPEIFSVDIAKLSNGLDIDDATAVLAGQAAPDPVEMAAVLIDALDDAAMVDGDPTHFQGRLTFAEYGAAFGQDTNEALGEMSTLFDQFGGDAPLDVLDEIVVDVDVRLDADGAVDLLRFDIDMSPLFAALPELMAAGGGAEAGDMGDQFASMLEGANFKMTMLLDYDITPALDVDMPSGDFPDATEQFAELLASAQG